MKMSRSRWLNRRPRGPRLFVWVGLTLLVLGVGRTAPAQDSAERTSGGEVREMELQRYRDAVRRHFVLREYEQLLELTEEYGHLFPENESTEFYRTQAELRLAEAERSIPFQRLQDRPFEIPGADEGAPSLLEVLRENGGTGLSGIGPESDDGRVAMSLPPAEDERLQVPLESPDAVGGFETMPDFQTEPEATPSMPTGLEGESSDMPPPPPSPDADFEGEGATAATGGGSSPLLLILVGSAVVLGAIATFLILGLMRRKRAAEEPLVAAAAAPAAAATAGTASPPLFQFDEPDEFAPSAGTEFGEGEVDVFADADSSVGEPAGAAGTDTGVASPLGETRVPDANQDISDLLFAPDAPETGAAPSADSVAPPPLGETQMVGGETGGGSQSDLVQLPDFDSMGSDAGSGPEELSGGAPAAPQSGPASGGAADLSSIDLFGEGTSGGAPESVSADEATSHLDLDELSAGESGEGSSSESPASGAADSMDLEIPFSLEDPFQDLSKSGAGHGEPPASGEAPPAYDETAFQSSTAETLSERAADIETSHEERELLQAFEGGDGGGTANGAETGAGEAFELWSETVERPPAGEGEAEASPSSEAVLSFQEDETAVVELSDVEDEEPPTANQPPAAEAPAPDEPSTANAGNETDASDLPDDPFEREHVRGSRAFDLEDWDKAVHHLSIAVALRPDANEVRDQLRRARKLRKEQRGE
jgi:hypothetical protein